MAGYSGKPLAEKLGLRSGHQVALVGAPDEFPGAIDGIPDGVTFVRPKKGYGDAPVVLLFVTEAAVLERTMPQVVDTLPAGGMCWVAWPKRAAQVPTDVTETIVRRVGLATGLVDVKVCAVSEVWSGLKFVHRRPAPAPRPRR